MVREEERIPKVGQLRRRWNVPVRIDAGELRLGVPRVAVGVIGRRRTDRHRGNLQGGTHTKDEDHGVARCESGPGEQQDGEQEQRDRHALQVERAQRKHWTQHERQQLGPQNAGQRPAHQVSSPHW